MTPPQIVILTQGVSASGGSLRVKTVHFEPLGSQIVILRIH